jgi:thiamine biosynthesis lipoprotein ApbE
VYTFALHNQSVSTSGLRAIKGDRDKPAHVYHPGMGYLESAPRHVSVLSSSATDAEVLSTVLLISGADKARGMLEKFPGCRAVQVDYLEGSTRVTELNV